MIGTALSFATCQTAQRQRLDRRPAEAAGDVAENRRRSRQLTAMPTKVLTATRRRLRRRPRPSRSGDVGHVRRQLRDERETGNVAAAADDPPRHLRVGGEVEPARDIRARQIQLQPRQPCPDSCSVPAIAMNSSSVLPAMLPIIAVGSVRRYGR